MKFDCLLIQNLQFLLIRQYQHSGKYTRYLLSVLIVFML